MSHENRSKTVLVMPARAACLIAATATSKRKEERKGAKAC